ncbi:hypothetical protein VTK26DRAFT_3225 [Humicola hyalothermophila]
MEMQDEDMWAAKQEDTWEKLVRRQRAVELARPGLTAEERKKLLREWEAEEGAGAGFTAETSYAATLGEACDWLSQALNREWEDWVARGEAMWEMVLAEKKLAEEEDRERMARGEKVEPRVWSRHVWESRKPRLSKKGGKKSVEKKAEVAGPEKNAGPAGGDGEYG